MLKSTKKRFDLIQTKLDELTQKYDENFEKMLRKSEQYEKISEMIQHIKFKVDKAKVVFDAEKGIYMVDIKFLPQEVKLYIDNGNAVKNEFLYAISSLDMLTIQDMRILNDLIEQAKIKSKN